MDIIKYVICALAGYAFGSVSVAVLLCRAIKHEDVRTKGSKNAGATNVARVYGLKMGLLTFCGDFAKTGLSVLVGWLLLGDNGAAIASMGCLVGHCWPVFFGFKGGKGVVVGAAICFFIDWRIFVIVILLFLIIAFITKRVSVGSLIASFMVTPVILLLGERAPLSILLGVMVTAVIWILHIPNIRRILNHTEGEFKPKK